MMLGAAAATAQAGPRDAEITPYAGFGFGGTFEDADSAASAELDDDAAFGVIFNLRQAGNTQWEIIYSRQATTADTAGLLVPEPALEVALDVDIHYFQGGGTYQGDGERVRPYLAATIGGTHIAPRSSGFESDTFFSFSIGTGLQVRPSERLGLRLEARAFGTLVDSDSRLFCTSDSGGGLCAIAVDGNMLWQLQTFAGLVFRF
jgi:opacity protein-like surface antigen